MDSSFTTVVGKESVTTLVIRNINITTSCKELVFVYGNGIAYGIWENGFIYGHPSNHIKDVVL